jgi:hypothetical protein
MMLGLSKSKLIIYAGIFVIALISAIGIYWGGYSSGANKERLKQERLIREAQNASNERLKEIEGEYEEIYRSISNENDNCNGIFNIIERLPSPRNN